MAIFYAVLFLFMVIVAIVEDGQSNLNSDRILDELAKRTGLSYELVSPSSPLQSPHAVCIYRGRSLELSNVSTVIDGWFWQSTQIRLDILAQTNDFLQLSSKGRFARSSIQIGSEHFQRRFFIKSHPDGFARGVLASSELRQRLLGMPHGAVIRVNCRQLSFTLPFIEDDVDRLHRLLDLVVDLAEAVDRSRKKTANASLQ